MGRFESVLWKRTDRRKIRQITLAARRYDPAGKEKSQRSGPIGPVGIEVLELLGNVVDFKAGWLEPSIVWMMRKLHRSRDAIVRGLKALQQHGFLDWMRRYVPTGNDTGPQIRQTSNAYRMSLPDRARHFLGLIGEPAPLPDDFAGLISERRETTREYCNCLSLPDLATLEFGDTRLGRAIASLGAPTCPRCSLVHNESLWV